ncbi:MAG: hypothetical protein ABIJ05_04530 [Patescibacteria group bacterium]
MKPEHHTEYHARGKFPESKRFLLIGPRMQTFTTLTTRGQLVDDNKPFNDYMWKGELEVNGKDIKGKIVFEKNAEGDNFKTEKELLDFLAKKYSISYLRDKSKPAVETG